MYIPPDHFTTEPLVEDCRSVGKRWAPEVRYLQVSHMTVTYAVKDEYTGRNVNAFLKCELEALRLREAFASAGKNMGGIG